MGRRADPGGAGAAAGARGGAARRAALHLHGLACIGRRTADRATDHRLHGAHGGAPPGAGGDRARTRG